VAILAALSVVERPTGTPAPLCFADPTQFTPDVRTHLSDVVLRYVNQISARLQIAPDPLELAIETPGAATACGLPVCVAGHSLDVPFLVATLAARLWAPVPTGIVCTGHLPAAGGGIAMVSHLAAKVQTAANAREIDRIVIPAADSSAGALLPDTVQTIAAAVAAAREHKRVDEVTRVSEVLALEFSDTALVLAALERDFFDVPPPAPGEPGEVAAAARFLIGAAEARFWSVLERALQRGDLVDAARLLRARLEFATRRGQYPHGFGGTLQRYIAAVPPAVLRRKLPPPLVPLDVCIRLAQHAGAGDYEDVVLLFEVVAGRGPAWSSASALRPATPPPPAAGSELLDLVSAEISDGALTERIDAPINHARATFPLTRNAVDSRDEFHDMIVAFTTHVLQHTGGLTPPVDRDAVGAKALRWLEDAFPGPGGYQAVLAEAMEPTGQGGLHYVLNEMTKQFRKRRREEHVDLVLKRTLRDQDSATRAAFVAALLNRLRPYLPSAPRYADPAAFAHHSEELAQVYVAALDQINGTLRRF